MHKHDAPSPDTTSDTLTPTRHLDAFDLLTLALGIAAALTFLVLALDALARAEPVDLAPVDLMTRGA